jgi:hypothetical protein
MVVLTPRSTTMNRRMNLLLDDIRTELAPRPDEPPAEDDGTGDEMPGPGEDIPIDEGEGDEQIIQQGAKAVDELLRLRDLPDKVRKFAVAYKQALARKGPAEQKAAAHSLLLSAGAYAGKWDKVVKGIRQHLGTLNDAWVAHKRIVRGE